MRNAVSRPQRRRSRFQPDVGSTRRRLASALRRQGVGVALWTLCTLGAVGAAGLAMSTSGQHPLPSRLKDAEMRDRLLLSVARAATGAPADAGPQLARVYLETGEKGAFPSTAVEALRRSYQLEPLGPDATQWRLRFIFDHWTVMPSDLRSSAQKELRAAFPRHGWAMRDLPGEVFDPSGRMVATLLFETLRIEQTARTIDAERTHSSRAPDRSTHNP